MRSAVADSVAMASAVLLIALATAVFGSNAMQRVVANAAVMLTGVLALQIFSGNTRIVSFGHAAFMGIGAYAVGILTMSGTLQRAALPELPHFMAGYELSLLPALAAAVIAGLIAGALSGASLLRLSGAAASIATLALLIIVYTLLVAARAAQIIVGIVTAQTGSLASYDQPSLAGFRMAINEVNARGGLGGRYPVKLLVRDTRSDTATTAAAAQELVDAGVKILITPCDADPSIVAGQISQPAGIPTLTFCGTAPILPGAVGDMMFSTYPTDNLQAAALATYARELGLRKVYLLTSPDSTYTAQLPEYFATVFRKKGGVVVGKGSFAMNQPDFSVAVTTIRNLRDPPDVIMTAAYEPDFPAFVRQLRASGVATPVFGADALGTPTVAGLGRLVEGVMFTAAGCATPGSRLEGFNKRFKEVTGRAPTSTYEVNGYEIGLILDAAVSAARSDAGRAIRNALANLADFPGVTGTITYRGTERIPVRSVALLRYENGHARCVKSVTPAATDIPGP